MSIYKGFMAALLGCVVLSGCATMPANGPQDINDPFESFNRASFDVTMKVDKAVYRPIADGYRRIFPNPVRLVFRNFLNNLDSPIIFTNDVLQGSLDRAGVTLLRAGVNTTIGLGGLVDVARRWGYIRHSEDFGQTLGVYGVGEGPYIFVPLVGPGNPRDIVGWGVDFAFDPLTYAQWREKFWYQAGRSAVDFVDLRARNIETLDDVERSSLDFYASVRSLYRQTRNNEIRNGATEVQDLPDF
ncbi:MAG TPA: VacJ family lipoprotein [Micropepsaceae bacterium]|nr:VacJ family lipoprotein [Micropepsaceae bacterium]